MSDGPVIAGVAQVANQDEDLIVHPVDLIEQAARAALDDAGLRPEQVGGVLAAPLSTTGSARASELVAGRLGLPAGWRDEASYSGAGPQRLLARAAGAVAVGEVDAVLVVGGIADASVRRARRLGIEPPAEPTAAWSQGSVATDRSKLRAEPAWTHYVAEHAAGAGLPSAYFALVESALHPGVDPIERRRRLGELLAPFTAVAARRPGTAWFPTARPPEDLARVSDENRLIAEPYTKLMCSFPTVDLAAAIVVSRESLGSDRSVRPLAVTAAHEAGPPSTRASIARSPALELAVAQAVALAEVSADDIRRFDLYSCFPAAIQLATRAFGLPDDDPRPRTVTGGLPYFGGPGASYSLHGVVCMVEELRADPGSVGAVVGVGGMVDDFSVGIYTTGDAPFASADLGTVAVDPVVTRADGEGRAVVDAMTVLHERDRGITAAPVIARFEDGTRIGARAGDPHLPEELAGTSLVGREVTIANEDGRAVYAPV